MFQSNHRRGRAEVGEYERLYGLWKTVGKARKTAAKHLNPN
jgi:hypothetical protein